MRVKKKTLKKEKSAMSVSMYGNLLFVLIELVMAVYTSSQAVLLDAVYDGIEFFMLLPSVLLIPLLYKPSNEKHPYGYMQIETIFIVIKGITMTAVTIGLITNNINLLFHGGREISFGTVAYFKLFACVLGIAVSIYLRQKNKNLNSPLIQVEMEGWMMDSGVSLGMAAAFFLPAFIHVDWFQSLTPYLDQIITIILSMIMLPVPIRTVISGIRDLMLLPPEEETVQQIREIVERSLEGTGYRDIQHEIVRTGRKLWISTYITLDNDEVSLLKFQTAQAHCIEALKEVYTDFYFELLPHIEFTEEQLPAEESV